MKHITQCLTVFFCILSVQANAQLTAPGYTNYTLNGFNVLIWDDAFEINPTMTNQAKNLLEDKLYDFTQLNIDQTKIDSLQTVPIFLDWNTSDVSIATYYKSNTIGTISQKFKCIAIRNIGFFIASANNENVVVHELAHAYHDQFASSSDNYTINNAYNNAVTNNLYQNIWTLDAGGNYFMTDEPYLMTNRDEYFAELTEAYFDINVTFPFFYTQISYDPDAVNMLTSIWGDISSEQSFIDISPKMHQIEPTVYPNPTKGEVTFTIDNKEFNTAYYFLTDLYGRVISTSEFKSGNYSTTLNIADKPNGIYLLKIVQDNQSRVVKIVKE